LNRIAWLVTATDTAGKNHGRRGLRGLQRRNPALRKRDAARQRRLRDGLAEALRARQPDDLPFAVEPEALATAFLALGLGLAQEALVDHDAVPDGLFGEILSLAYDGNAARAGRLP
jgi:hypothetical protein